MKYIELLGLPVRGKTTLLRSLRRREFDLPRVKTLLSEDWVMVLRRFGYRDFGLFRGLKRRELGVPRQEMSRKLLFDSWHMGILDEYPELFAQILLCLKTVRPDDRQRAILLNYWRSRASLYLDVSRDTTTSFCVVDEGL